MVEVHLLRVEVICRFANIKINPYNPVNISVQMSRDAEISQPPEVGIEPGPEDLKAKTLPRRCKSRLLQQGSRSVLYTYPYYIYPCFKLIRPRIYSEPRCYSVTFHPDARTPHTGHQMSQGAEKSQPPEVGIEPGLQDLKANTLPRPCKSRLLLQGSRSVLYTYPYYTENVICF